MQQRDQRVIEEFGKRRKRQLMLTVPFIAAMVLLFVAKDRVLAIDGLSQEAFGGIMLVVVVGLLGFSFKNWRCPACNRYLGKAWNPRFCAGCGVPLQGS
ncbi:MAG TPA: hypothetical protein VGB20_03150 [bacterium]